MKNILVVNHSFFQLSETFIHKQVLGLTRNNNVSLLGYKFINEDKFQTSCKKYKLNNYTSILDKILTLTLSKILKIDFIFSIRNKDEIVNLIKKNNIHVIHVHFGYFALGILPIAKKLNIPLVVSFHGIDASPAYVKNIKYCVDLQKLFAYANAVIIVSPHMVETLNLKKWQNKVHLIPYGVDFYFFKNKNKTSNPVIKILHSGRIVGKKGVPDLIKVFFLLCEKYSNIYLDIIGDGKEYETCTNLINKSKFLAQIKLHGSQSQKAIKSAMETTDIFVLNSRTDEKGDMEGLPNSILEAMSMELSVVSTYHAGIPKVISDGVNGLLILEKDNNGLFIALERLITDPTLRNKLSINARNTIIEQFGIEKMQSEINSVFLTI